MTLNYEWQWMGQQWERSLFCQFQLLGSYWEVHWLKLAPGLKKVTWGKTTPLNIFFRPILPNFDNRIEVGDDDFGGCSMLPVCKTSIVPLPMFQFNCYTISHPCPYPHTLKEVEMLHFWRWNLCRQTEVKLSRCYRLRPCTSCWLFAKISPLCLRHKTTQKRSSDKKKTTIS